MIEIKIIIFCKTTTTATTHAYSFVGGQQLFVQLALFVSQRQPHHKVVFAAVERDAHAVDAARCVAGRVVGFTAARLSLQQLLLSSQKERLNGRAQFLQI